MLIRWASYFRKVIVATAAVAIVFAVWGYSFGFVRTRHSAPWYLNTAPGDHAAFTLITLDPVRETRVPSSETIGPWAVIGVAALDQRTGHSLRELLAASVAKRWDDYPACFEPRHALRIRSGLVWSQFLVCFECGQMDTEFGVGPVVLARDHVVLSRDGRAAFNGAAARYRLPVAPPVAGPLDRG